MADEGGKQSYSLSAYGRLLRDNRNFRRLWIAQIISETGDWLYSVAIYSLLLEFTGQARSIGTALVLQVLPQVFMAPLAGVLNDRLSRKAIMIGADIARTFIVLGMVLVTSADRVWLVWILLLLETVGWALFEPGRSAVVPAICENDDDRLVANALSSTTWAVNFAVGAGIGGLLAYAFGRQTLFVLNGLSFLASAWLIAGMRFEEPHTAGHAQFKARDLFDYRPILEGFQYIKKDPRLLATLGVKAGMGLLGAHWVILPLLGQRVFPLGGTGSRAGTLGMSLLLSSRGVGSLFGSFLAGAWAGNDEKRLRSGVFWGFVIVAVSYMALGGAPTLLLACLAVMVGHAGTSICWVLSTTMMQSLTEDRFRGRVFSADFAGLFLVMSLSNYGASWLADWGVSVRALAVMSGVLGFLPAGLWLLAQRLWPRVHESR